MFNIKNVTVVGTGVIGAGWIIRCLAHNKKVVAFDLAYLPITAINFVFIA